MNWQQFLTEKVLKECYHETEPTSLRCIKCGTNVDYRNWRTFDNRNDLMDLYEQIEKDGKWEDFFWDFAFQRKPENYGLGEAETSVWLFCLDGKGYKEKCRMVAEFYGWEESHD